MLDGPAFRRFDRIAAKWRDFAEKRRQYFVELHRSGRWKYYYDSEDGIVLRVQEAAMLVEVWAVLAPPVEPETADATHAPASRRSAA